MVILLTPNQLHGFIKLHTDPLSYFHECHPHLSKPCFRMPRYSSFHCLLRDRENPFFSPKELAKMSAHFFPLSLLYHSLIGEERLLSSGLKKKKTVNLLFYTVKQNRKLQQPATHKPPVVQQANIS